MRNRSMWMFPQGDQPGVDRSALMKRAHLLAHRFRDLMPSYRAAPVCGLQ